MKRALLACLLLGVLTVLLSGCALDDILNNMVNREPRAVIDAKPLVRPCAAHGEPGCPLLARRRRSAP